MERFFLKRGVISHQTAIDLDYLFEQFEQICLFIPDSRPQPEMKVVPLTHHRNQIICTVNILYPLILSIDNQIVDSILLWNLQQVG
jgi:hypothetical protein